MATPAEIAAASNCYRCIGDQQAALLYVFATIAGVTPEQIQAGSACFKCIGDPMSALVYLADQILAASSGDGGGGIGSVLCGAVAPVAAPTTSCALYYDTVSTALYYWDGAAWQLKV